MNFWKKIGRSKKNFRSGLNQLGKQEKGRYNLGIE